MRHRCPEPRQISGETLEGVVRRYLSELSNPAPDYGMRETYREWMGEFVGIDRAADRKRLQERRT